MNNNTPLITLIRRFRSSESISASFVVQRYINQHRGSVNERDEDNDTPLHWATMNQLWPVMRVLLENGADVNAVDDTNKTPLMEALSGEYLAGITILLQFNADTMRRDPDSGMNALETIQEMLRIGPDENLVNIRNLIQEYNNNNSGLQQPEFAESGFFKMYEPRDECSICLEPIADGRQICLNMNCIHGYHCGCITRALQQTGNRCPLCRAPVKIVPLNELQQRALQNSFGKRKLKMNIKKLLTFERYLKRIK